MKRKNNCIQKQPRGQSLVELAISLMVILLLLLGAVEISIALFQYVAIRDASEEGATYGSIRPEDETGIKRRVQESAADVLSIDQDAVQVTINGFDVNSAKIAKIACENTFEGSTNFLTVVISYPHVITFPIIGPIISSDNMIHLRASTTNAILQPKCPE